MEQTYSVVISLIKSGLCGEKVTIPNDVNWQRVLQICKKHQIIPLVYYGIANSALNFKEKTEFLNLTMQCVFQEQQQLYALKKLKGLFLAHSIDHLPLKGSVLKLLYPQTEMRVMSDIDILIRQEQYGEIQNILADAGFIEGIETDHEYHWKLPPYVSVELHKRLISRRNIDYYSYFGDGWNRAVASHDNTHEFSYRDEDNLIYLIGHLAKHYRASGIGLRQLIDIWVLMNERPDMDMNYIQCELERLGLHSFYLNVVATVKSWFADGETTELTEFLTIRTFESGSYGTLDRNHMAAGIWATAVNHDVPKAKRREFWKLVFMPLSEMQIKYPFLKKAPIFLPIMWIVRWISALLFKRNNIQTQRKKLQSINAETIDSYSAELAFVGLRFDLNEGE